MKTFQGFCLQYVHVVVLVINCHNVHISVVVLVLHCLNVLVSDIVLVLVCLNVLVGVIVLVLDSHSVIVAVGVAAAAGLHLLKRGKILVETISFFFNDRWGNRREFLGFDRKVPYSN